MSLLDKKVNCTKINDNSCCPGNYGGASARNSQLMLPGHNLFGEPLTKNFRRSLNT